jgi:hypothetical protein
MTSQGHPTMRLRRALDHGNTIEALSAAAEIKVVPLSQALELVLLLARQDPAKASRASLRWHARYVREHRVDDPLEAQAVLVLLTMLTGPSAAPAARALAQLLQARRFGQAAEALVRWAG